MQMCIMYPKYSKFSRGNKKLPIKGPIKVATLLNRYHIKELKKIFLTKFSIHSYSITKTWLRKNLFKILINQLKFFKIC